MRWSPIWWQVDFLRCWGAASVSLVGDAVTRLALSSTGRLTVLPEPALDQPG